MRFHVLGSLGLVSVLLVAGAGEVRACGDKFMVVGRGVRSQRTRGAVTRASVLIYSNPRTDMRAALDATGLERELELAGHRVSVVEDAASVETALAGSRHDVVLADISDMAALERQVQAAGSRTALLPLIYNPTGAELAAAEDRYECVMKSPSKRQHFLSVLNEALAERANGAGRRR